jgi:hypothetical protein
LRTGWFRASVVVLTITLALAGLWLSPPSPSAAAEPVGGRRPGTGRRALGRAESRRPAEGAPRGRAGRGLQRAGGAPEPSRGAGRQQPGKAKRVKELTGRRLCLQPRVAWKSAPA